MSQPSIEIIRTGIEAEWRWMRGTTHLPRFLAKHRGVEETGASIRRLRAWYLMAGDRISLAEMLVLSGGVHRGDR